LSSGSHRVEFKNPNPSTSTYIDIDSITITGEPDTTPPAVIDPLNAVTGSGFGEVVLTWMAVGDDGTTGMATSYEVRYSNNPITTDGTWNSATPFANSLVPKPAGGNETLTVGGLFSATPFYFAVRAKDEAGNRGDLLSSPSATATQPTPVAPGTYDDTNPAWGFTGGWLTYSGAGPLNNTMHYTNSQFASASIAFTGIGFTVKFARAMTRGNVEVWIDGIKRDEFTFSQYGSSVVWQQSWTLPTALSYGTHIVQFKNPSASTNIDIDSITIVGPVMPGTYDDANPAWSYTGTWITYSGAGPLNNTMHYTNSQNAGASITFTGTSFTLYFARATTRGNVEVWVDGIKRDDLTFSQYGSSVVWQQSWTLPTPLSAGTHKVEFKNPSASTNIDIDVIVIS
jgi:hypothetical protein